MKAMILAAGEGTRLRPLTDTISKVMVEIGGKPLLEHNINLAKSYGIRDLVINVYYQPNKIVDYFQDGNQFGVHIDYSKEKELLGSAGGVKNVEEKLTEPFFLLYGDNFTNCNLASLLLAHQKSKAICTIALFDIKKNKNSGIAGGRVLINEDHSVRQFIEGGAAISDLVNAGVYVLDPKIFKYIPTGQKYDFGKDLFPQLLQNGITINTYQLGDKEYVFGCDTIECYEKTQTFFKKIK